MGLFGSKYGGVNKKLECPHCKGKGCVRQKFEERRAGLNPGLAAGGLLASTLSGGLLAPFVLFRGFHDWVKVAVCHCDDCGSDWVVEGDKV